jgi:hypothetical protein
MEIASIPWATTSREPVACLDAACADRVAGGRQLAPRALGMDHWCTWQADGDEPGPVMVERVAEGVESALMDIAEVVGWDLRG